MGKSGMTHDQFYQSIAGKYGHFSARRWNGLKFVHRQQVNMQQAESTRTVITERSLTQLIFVTKQLQTHTTRLEREVKFMERIFQQMTSFILKQTVLQNRFSSVTNVPAVFISRNRNSELQLSVLKQTETPTIQTNRFVHSYETFLQEVVQFQSMTNLSPNQTVVNNSLISNVPVTTVPGIDQGIQTEKVSVSGLKATFATNVQRTEHHIHLMKSMNQVFKQMNAYHQLLTNFHEQTLWLRGDNRAAGTNETFANHAFGAKERAEIRQFRLKMQSWFQNTNTNRSETQWISNLILDTYAANVRQQSISNEWQFQTLQRVFPQEQVYPLNTILNDFTVPNTGTNQKRETSIPDRLDQRSDEDEHTQLYIDQRVISDSEKTLRFVSQTEQYTRNEQILRNEQFNREEQVSLDEQNSREEQISRDENSLPSERLNLGIDEFQNVSKVDTRRSSANPITPIYNVNHPLVISWIRMIEMQSQSMVTTQNASNSIQRNVHNNQFLIEAYQFFHTLTQNRQFIQNTNQRNNKQRATFISTILTYVNQSNRSEFSNENSPEFVNFVAMNPDNPQGHKNQHELRMQPILEHVATQSVDSVNASTIQVLQEKRLLQLLSKPRILQRVTRELKAYFQTMLNADFVQADHEYTNSTQQVNHYSNLVNQHVTKLVNQQLIQRVISMLSVLPITIPTTQLGRSDLVTPVFAENDKMVTSLQPLRTLEKQFQNHQFLQVAFHYLFLNRFQKSSQQQNNRSITVSHSQLLLDRIMQQLSNTSIRQLSTEHRTTDSLQPMNQTLQLDEPMMLLRQSVWNENEEIKQYSALNTFLTSRQLNQSWMSVDTQLTIGNRLVQLFSIPQMKHRLKKVFQTIIQPENQNVIQPAISTASWQRTNVHLVSEYHVQQTNQTMAQWMLSLLNVLPNHVQNDQRMTQMPMSMMDRVHAQSVQKNGMPPLFDPKYPFWNQLKQEMLIRTRAMDRNTQQLNLTMREYLSVLSGDDVSTVADELFRMQENDRVSMDATLERKPWQAIQSASRYRPIYERTVLTLHRMMLSFEQAILQRENKSAARTNERNWIDRKTTASEHVLERVIDHAFNLNIQNVQQFTHEQLVRIQETNDRNILYVENGITHKKSDLVTQWIQELQQFQAFSTFVTTQSAQIAPNAKLGEMKHGNVIQFMTRITHRINQALINLGVPIFDEGITNQSMNGSVLRRADTGTNGSAALIFPTAFDREFGREVGQDELLHANAGSGVGRDGVGAEEDGWFDGWTTPELVYPSGGVTHFENATDPAMQSEQNASHFDDETVLLHKTQQSMEGFQADLQDLKQQMQGQIIETVQKLIDPKEMKQIKQKLDILDVDRIVDRVYREMEQKINMERQRKGIF